MKRAFCLLLSAVLAGGIATAHAGGLPAASSHRFTARITVTGTQGAPTSKGMAGTLAGRGRSPQFGKLALIGKGYQKNGPGYLIDNFHATLTFASGGTVTLHLTGTDGFADNMTRVIQSVKFTVTGGTGPYANVTGSGTIHASCPNDPNSASLVCPQNWKGTLSY